MASSLFYGFVTILFSASIDVCKAQSPNKTLEQILRDQSGTTSVQVIPQFAQGRLYACGIEFAHLMRDWIYSQGRFIRVGGSFGVMQAQGKIAVVLKVIVHDFDPRAMEFTPSPPFNAYFVSGTKTSAANKVDSVPSDTPGALFVIFQPAAMEMLVGSLVEKKVTIAFSRRRGGADVIVPIDTTVQDTDSNGTRKRTDKVALEFLDCAKLLSQRRLALNGTTASTPSPTTEIPVPIGDKHSAREALAQVRTAHQA